jgi:hypothetical protein
MYFDILREFPVLEFAHKNPLNLSSRIKTIGAMGGWPRAKKAKKYPLLEKHSNIGTFI